MRQQATREYVPVTPASVSPALAEERRLNGMVSELVYRNNDIVLTHILLPLLRQLAGESRWLLWLSPGAKLNRTWLSQNQLPGDKIMQCPASRQSTVLPLWRKHSPAVTTVWFWAGCRY